MGSIARVIPRRSRGPRPGWPYLRLLRRLMHPGADTVTDELPDHRVAVALHIGLDGCGDILQPVALLRKGDPLEEAGSGHIDQVLGLRGDGPAGEGGRAVAVEPFDIRAHTSTLTISPSCKTRFPGMPWMTSSLTLMQTLAG